jgi:hypothetical protein
VICWFTSCRRPISRAEEGKRAEWHRVGGEELVFGEGMPDGTLAEASGPLIKTSHGKCYFAQHHRGQLESGAIAWRQVLDAARSEDPAPAREHVDWRDQEAHDVEELTGEGNGDHRGAGAPGV